jgi:aminoglycoside/choline kinase family phosphotransferase
VSDRELAAALGWSAVRREPWARASSAPMALLRSPEGARALLKELGAALGPRPRFAADPRRELAAYGRLPAAAAAPRCLAADPDGAWLVLELLDGVTLAEAGTLDAWEQAARTLARLHAAPLPDGDRLLRHDAAHLSRWVERALAAEPALRVAEPAARAAVARLAALPAVLVHGEAYPANVVVAGGRVRLVDWETAGPGPGVLDLAALTSGAWEPGERARVVAAYRDAAVIPPEDADLGAARLLVACQWLGWSPTWTPPPAHRHDWLGDVLALTGGSA